MTATGARPPVPRGGRQRRRTLGLALALTMTSLPLLACQAGERAGSGGGCVAPRLEAEPTVVAPGSAVDVRGTGFFDGCIDGAGNGEDPGAMEPLDAVVVVATQAEVVIAEVAVDVDDDDSFTTSLDLPADATDDPVTLDVPDVPGADAATLSVGD